MVLVSFDVERQDAMGRTYYHHTVDGTTQWEKPASFNGTKTAAAAAQPSTPGTGGAAQAGSSAAPAMEWEGRSLSF